MKRKLIAIEENEDEIHANACKETLLDEIRVYKKVKHSTTVNESRPPIEVFECLLPSFLSKKLWLKHGYSIQDIEQTLKSFPGHYLWPLMIAENLIEFPGKQSAHKSRRQHSSVQLPLNINCRERLRNHFAKIFPSSPSCFCTLQGKRAIQTFPPLPTHRIEEKIFESIFGTIAESISNLYNHSFKKIFAWKQGLYIPIYRQSKTVILMKRVVPLETYREIYKYFNEPTIVVRHKKRRFALLEEAFFVTL